MMIKMCRVWVKKPSGFDAVIHPEHQFFSPERAREMAAEYKQANPGATTVVKWSGYEYGG